MKRLVFFACLTLAACGGYDGPDQDTQQPPDLGEYVTMPPPHFDKIIDDMDEYQPKGE